MLTYYPYRAYRRLRGGSFLFQTEVTEVWERTPLPGSSSEQLGSSHYEHLHVEENSIFIHSMFHCYLHN